MIDVHPPVPGVLGAGDAGRAARLEPGWRISPATPN
jgi:hypothetical protein